MRGSISERIIKPENCVVAFAIPTNRPTFEDHRGLGRDFASMHEGWEHYEGNVAKLYRRLEPAFRDLGVHLRTRVKICDFGNLFSGEFDVIILFAHWRQNTIEFDDGFADIASTVSKVPIGFHGLLDLCACHPRELAAALQRERGQLLVKSLESEPASPRLWLSFYLALFVNLRDEASTYLAALETTVKQFSNSILGRPHSEHE